jgi:hypothetical protein
VKRNRQSSQTLSRNEKEFLARLRKGLLETRRSIGVRISEVALGSGYCADDFSAVERGQALPSAKMLAHWLRRLFKFSGLADRTLGRAILLRFRRIPAAARRSALSTK